MNWKWEVHDLAESFIGTTFGTPHVLQWPYTRRPYVSESGSGFIAHFPQNWVLS